MSESLSENTSSSTFPEEQLDSAAGYFPAKPGQSLDGKRWTIIRKLGWGPRSSTWLAVDNNESDLVYRAIKILTTTATEDSTGNNERYFLLLDPLKDMSGICRLRGHFYEHDIKGKRHLCLVFHTFGDSVEELRLTNINGENLPLHAVKLIAARISTSLVHLAELKIIHGGGKNFVISAALASLIFFCCFAAVTPDNFRLFCAQAGNDIQMVLKQSKNKRPEVQNIVGSDGITYPSVKSQPIPHYYTWDSPEIDWELSSLYLSNFAYGMQSELIVSSY